MEGKVYSSIFPLNVDFEKFDHLKEYIDSSKEKKMKTEIVKSDGTEVTGSQEAVNTITKHLQNQDITPEKLDALERILALQFKYQDRLAEEAYNRAISAFQAECPSIKKDIEADFPTQRGGRMQYSYSSYGEMVHTIQPIMKRHGLSFSFSLKEINNMMELTTTIAHVDGHKRSFTSPHERLTKGKGATTSAQDRRAAMTTAKRGGLELALGLVSVDDEEEKRHSIETEITEAQLKEIEGLLKDTHTEIEDFEKYMNVSTVKILSQYEAQRAINSLKQKRRALLEISEKQGGI